MFYQSDQGNEEDRMLIQTLAFALVRRVGPLLLGGVVLWEVATHCGSTSGHVIVHVSEPQVHVAVDSATYWVENLADTPIVCDLGLGRHQVQMVRNGRVVYQEEFMLAAGEERILSAWDVYAHGKSPKPAD
jgi:hypothetical protein